MKSLLLLFATISLIGCVNNKSEEITETAKIITSKITIDSIKTGIPGEPLSMLEIITRVDTTINKRESKYWGEKKKEYAERFEYFDSLGREYRQTDFDDNNHSYVWYDTIKNEIGYNEWIASIDSTFNSNGKLQKIEQRYLGTELTEYFNSRGNVYKKLIYSEKLIYSFWEENNEFYIRRNDIPISYAEWMQTSKTHFGEAIKLFYDSKIRAQLRFKEIYNIELN